MRILVFGDSVTYGAWDSQGGWVDRLKQHFHKIYIDSQDYKNNLHQVLNLGIGGNTTTELLGRMEQEIIARKSNSWPFVFVISIGSNDSRGVDTADNIQVLLADFKENVQSIIDVAQKYTDKILFVGKSPLSAEEVQFKNYFYNRVNIKTYDSALGDIAEANGIKKVEVFDAFMKHDLSKLYAHDKLHPNDEGHKLIADLVKPELDKLLR